jgi:hypothetical protein
MRNLSIYLSIILKLDELIRSKNTGTAEEFASKIKVFVTAGMPANDSSETYIH